MNNDFNMVVAFLPYKMGKEARNRFPRYDSKYFTTSVDKCLRPTVVIHRSREITEKRIKACNES